ncbi:MAG: signal peptide peptidase SppA [Candidatus Saganbacteria bacterium]|nr:signal peptide peptidase SppA [Candidatus Saganbacteria bacterium]
MLLRQAIVCCLLAALAGASFADDLGHLLLKGGVSTRALGMGGAFSAVADDAGAVFCNPAGLAEPGFGYTTGSLDSQLTRNEFTYSALKLGYLGYSEGKVAGPGVGQVTFSAFGFGNRYGWLNWGTNYKTFSATIGGAASEGWSGDLGLLLRITPQFKVGVVAREVLTTQARLAPASLRLGLGYRPFNNNQLVLAADAELYRSLPYEGHLGVESSLVPGLTFRGGLDGSHPTAGASLDLAFFTLDYALQFLPGDQNIQRFEAGLKFNLGRERPFSFIKPKEFVIIDVNGLLKGGQSEISLLGGYRSGLDSLLEQVRAAEKDGSIDGIFLRLGGFSGGLGGAAVVQELRAELLRAKNKGKKIIAYVEDSALGDEYYLASVADKIVAAPGAAIGGFGRSLEIYRFGGLFKKFGVDYQVKYKGKYKSSFDWLAGSLSAEQKEMMEGLVGDIYRQMLTDIAASRKMKIEKVKEIGDGMIFPAGLALKMGLIDRVGFFRDASVAANELYGNKDEVKIVQPNLLEPEESFFSQLFGVAVIEVDGEIVEGDSGQNLVFGGSYVGADKLARDIRGAADDPFVKALLVRVNSPGGSAVAAGEIYQALQYAREKKKVIIASLGDVAASGGYYVAVAADKIVADPSSITGSIGVIGAFPVYHRLMENWDVAADEVKEGAHADMFSGLRRFSTIESEAVDRIFDETYRTFVNAVAAGRKLATAEVEKLAQGRVYTGNQALAVKLVDKLGGFSDAVELAKSEGKVKGEVRLIYYRRLNPLLQFGQGVSSALGFRQPLLDLPALGRTLQYK